MSNYDFKSLNDIEFEVLALDLLSNFKGILIERFKRGKDAGIDGRFYEDMNRKIIIQIKHYATTGYSGLISSLKKDEVAKVQKLNPSKYIFITSVPLSPANKNEIKKLFSPYIKNDADIIGNEGLNDLLRMYPKVEKDHFKLWLSSSNVLISLLNNGVNQKSEHLLTQSLKESHKHIKTQQFKKAQSILSENNALIITGLPGVGKTTLAKQLMLWYASQNYSVYHIEEAISEVESAYLKDVKQFFYFDDFLGSVYLQIFSSNGDSKIINFIKRIISDPTKKIILTSRTNILNRAKNLSEVFNIEKIEKKEFELNVSELSLVEKADILYNHMWHGLESADLSDVFYQDQNYWKIINHPNFNPRIISFITDLERAQQYDKDSYWTYIQDALNNPTSIWEKCFNNQTPPELFDLVCLIVLNGSHIIESQCKDALRKIFSVKYPNEYHLKTNKINSLIVESLKSTVTREISSTKSTSAKLEVVILKPFNPSISDYLLNRLAKDLDCLSLYFSSLNSFSSIDTLFSLYYNEKIEEHIFISVLFSLKEKAEKTAINDYTIHLYSKIAYSQLKEQYKKKLINCENFKSFDVLSINFDSSLIDCINWIKDLHPEIFSYDFYIDLVRCAIQTNNYSTLDHEDYLSLTTLISTEPGIMQEDIIDELKVIIINYWCDNVQEIIGNSSAIQDIFDERHRADYIAYDTLRKFTKDYNIYFDEADLDDIYSNFNVENVFNDEDYETYKTNEKSEEYHAYMEARHNANAYIDDLFRKHK